MDIYSVEGCLRNCNPPTFYSSDESTQFIFGSTADRFGINPPKNGLFFCCDCHWVMV